MSYTLSARSRESLQGVHPDLVSVVERAIAPLEQDADTFSGGEIVRAAE